mgnify:CR=1 FL=1
MLNIKLDDKYKSELSVEEMVKKIGATKMLRLEQWKGEEAWRGGIGWYSTRDYEFICEFGTLEDVLQRLVYYVENEAEKYDRHH